ncbi:hypothetical protein EMIT0P2_10931 [Pseudomonas sp. IT-P2]
MPAHQIDKSNVNGIPIHRKSTLKSGSQKKYRKNISNETITKEIIKHTDNTIPSRPQKIITRETILFLTVYFLIKLKRLISHATQIKSQIDSKKD